jgi:hypothetical protein
MHSNSSDKVDCTTGPAGSIKSPCLPELAFALVATIGSGYPCDEPAVAHPAAAAAHAAVQGHGFRPVKRSGEVMV